MDIEQTINDELGLKNEEREGNVPLKETSNMVELEDKSNTIEINTLLEKVECEPKNVVEILNNESVNVDEIKKVCIITDIHRIFKI